MLGLVSFLKKPILLQIIICIKLELNYYLWNFNTRKVSEKLSEMRKGKQLNNLKTALSVCQHRNGSHIYKSMCK